MLVLELVFVVNMLVFDGTNPGVREELWFTFGAQPAPFLKT